MKLENCMIRDMKFTEYVEAMVVAVGEHLGSQTEVKRISVKKNNGIEKTGIVVKIRDSKISPTIYLEDFYAEQRKWDVSLKDAVEEVLGMYKHAKAYEPEYIKIEWGNVKNKIGMQLIHSEWNKELLEEVPHISILDLAIVFYALIEDAGEAGEGRMLIYNEHLKFWNITQKELSDCATANTKDPRFAPKFRDMREVVYEIMGISGEPEEWEEEWEEQWEEENGLCMDERKKMYVLTNERNILGASALFYPGMMEEIGEELKTDYYIIPSSLHEVIIISSEREAEKKLFSQMVQEVNKNSVSKEEWLSDHVYYYSIRDKKLTM